MDWNATFARIQQLQGLQLASISGKSDIELVSVGAVNYVVRRQDGVEKTRKTAELQQLATSLVLNTPIHVDAAMFGGGSSRSHPETVLANLPDIEWQKIGVKRIVWVGNDTHPLGTLKQI